MNLTKLFDMQRKLDERIVHEKGLEGRNMLPEKVLALQVELGECANEWREFKFWSEDRKPRNYCLGCMLIETPHEHSNPLLEEYVDCLHFILSIGLELGFHYVIEVQSLPQNNIVDAFLDMFELIGTLDMKGSSHDYDQVVSRFIELGSMLGFTWEEIESAYMAKNEVNHSRQNNGY